MKKGIFIFGILLMGLGLVFAQGNGNQGDSSGCMEDAKVCDDGTIVVRVAPECNFEKCPSDSTDNVAPLSSGNYYLSEGYNLMIQNLENNRIQLKVRDSEVHTGLNITSEKIQNRTKLNVALSNGRNAEVKVMPDVASEKALERLRLNVCSDANNCSMELKEVGKGEQTKLAYELKTQRQAKFLGLFKTQMQVQSQVDAENGEIIQVKKPWWAFLASEPEEFIE